MRMDHFSPLLRSTIGFDRPFHLVDENPARPPAQRRRRGLRWMSAVHRRRHDDDDLPPAPAGMRLAVPQNVGAQREPDPAMLWAA